MKRMTIRTIALLAGAAFALGACDVARTLGLEREGPDEFQVLSHAPLTLPPDYRLRPPDPGAVRPQQVAPRDSARQTLTGGEAGGAAARSAGESALLSKVGGAQVDSSFRRRIDEETAEIAEKNRRLLDDLIFWEDRKSHASIVDAEAESKRLRENAALGKPPTEGETPTIQRR